MKSDISMLSPLLVMFTNIFQDSVDNCNESTDNTFRDK